MKKILSSRNLFTMLAAVGMLANNPVKAQIQYRGTSSATMANSTTLTITKPAGVVLSDLEIVTITFQQFSTTPPACPGWTLIDSRSLQNTSPVRGAAILYKVAGETEGDNYTFTFPSAVDGVGGIVAFSGVNTVSPFDVSPGTINVTQTNTNTVTANSVTTVNDRTAIIMLGMAANNFTYSGWTGTSTAILQEILDVQSANSSVGAAWAPKASPGPTGNGLSTLSGSVRNGGLLLALRPGAPVITDFSPMEICTGEETEVTINGSGFYSITSVTFNGEPAKSYTVSVPRIIKAIVPATITTGKIAVSNVIGTGTTSEDLVVNPILPVSNVLASQNNNQADLSWTNPLKCFDEIMVVGKAGSEVTLLPSGNGSAYTADLSFGSGTSFDGGYVVYKGSTPTQTVTNLAVGPAYYFTFFTRKGSVWSEGITVIAERPNVAGDYRSVAEFGGNWSSTDTWEYYNGSGWITPSVPPSSASNLITIRESHVVYLDTDVAVDQVVIENGGEVSMEMGVELTIANGPGDDFSVFGTLSRSPSTIVTTGTLVFGPGGTYNHAMDGGIIPDASWDTNSDCNISGVVYTKPDGLNPPGGFGNFSWNCSGQLSNISLLSDMMVKGDFSVGYTGLNRILAMSSNSTPCTITIGGDLNIVPPARFKMNTGSGSCILLISGDLNISGSITSGFFLNSSNSRSSATANIEGNLNISSGNLVFKEYGNPTGTAIINLNGNFNHTDGNVRNSQPGGNYTGDIYFTGTGTQIFNSPGVIAGHIINFTVSSGSYLQMGTPGAVASGAGTFSLQSGATLGITSPDGIMASGSTGNIQTAIRNFNSAANYVYNGLSAQNTGTGLPGTVASLVFDNSAGSVTLNSTHTITNDFSLTAGSRANLNSYDQAAGLLILGGAGQTTGSYGGTGSGATFIRTDFFDPATGVVNNSCPVGTWLGVTENWFADNNWSGGVPNSESPAIINRNTPYQPFISGMTIAECSTLTINSGASVRISPIGSLTVGTLVNNGTLTLESNYIDIGSLKLDVYSASSTGTNNIQIYLSGGGGPGTYSWHYLSSPIKSLSTDVFTNVTYNLAQYVESLPTSAVPNSMSRGWIAYDTYSYYLEDFTGSNGFSTLEIGKGYNYYNDYSQTYVLQGAINCDAVDVTLSYSGGDNSVSGYNLVGNPFTCGLDIQDLFTLGWPDNVLKAVWFTKDNVSYTFSSDVGVPGNVAGNIPATQGFFVKAVGAPGTLRFSLDAREHNDAQRYKGTKVSVPHVRMAISENGKTEETVVRFDNKANNALDMNFDAPRMFDRSDNPAIFSSTGGIDYTINGLPFPETSVEIPIAVRVLTNGNHKITALTIDELNDYNVFLKDKLTNTIVNLRNTSDLAFTSSSGLIKDRFVLTVTNLSTGIEYPSLSDGTFNIYSGFNLINIQTLSQEWDGKSGSVKIVDLSGKLLRNLPEVEFSRNSLIQVPSPGKNGLYIIEIRSGLMKYIGKVVVR